MEIWLFLLWQQQRESNAGVRGGEEDKCLCIILYSRDGVFDIVPVPSPVQNGCTPPRGAAARHHLAEDTGNANLV